MNQITQISKLAILLLMTSCATQVSPTISQDNPSSIEAKVIEPAKEVVEEVIVKKEEPQQEVLSKEPSEITAQPLSKNDRMNAVGVGKSVPTGTVYQTDNTPLSTESFKGKYTVIDFWATWCGPCVKEGPIFHALGETYRDKNVQFIGISVDRDFARWNQFLQQRNWQGNNYWMGMAEEEAFFAFAYSEVELEPGELGIIVGLPKYVILGPEGKILHNSSYTKPSNPKFIELLDQHIAVKD